MTFYEELQLNQAGSKKLIHESKDKKEKIYHTAVFLFKVFLTLAFCVGFVVLYSLIFGTENSITGVMLLLCIMTFRHVDLGFDTRHATPIFIMLFAILAFGPRLANMGNPFTHFLVNLICIGTLVFFGCHNIYMFNHATLVLSYLLLYGYDVTGPSYTKRVISIAIGALMCALIYYKNHRKKTYDKCFKDLFKDFDVTTNRTKWQITLVLGISSVLYIMELLNLPRVMWAGIATMSILTPIQKDMKSRALSRIPANIIGGILCYIFYTISPDFIYKNIGILGGLGVGLSATYGYQSLFNSFGAISVAASSLSLSGAIFYRVLNNAIGILYAIPFASSLNILFKRFSPKS